MNLPSATNTELIQEKSFPSLFFCSDNYENENGNMEDYDTLIGCNIYNLYFFFTQFLRL